MNDVVEEKIKGEGRKGKVKKRPKRLYKSKRGYYHLVNGKKRFLRTKGKTERAIKKMNKKKKVKAVGKIKKKGRRMVKTNMNITRVDKQVSVDKLPVFKLDQSKLNRVINTAEKQAFDKQVEQQKELEKNKSYISSLENLFRLLRGTASDGVFKPEPKKPDKPKTPSKGDEVSLDLLDELDELIAKKPKKPEEDEIEEAPKPKPVKLTSMNKGTFAKAFDKYRKETANLAGASIDDFVYWIQTSKKFKKYDPVKIVKKYSATFERMKREQLDKDAESEIEDMTEDDLKGSGRINVNGLWDTDLQKLLKKSIKNYVPVLGMSEIHNLPDLVGKKTREFGFVVNTLRKGEGDGTGRNGKVGHWTCAFISKDSKSIEYFDPLVQGPMDKELKRVCETIAKKMDSEFMFKLKENNLIRQGDTGNCGLFCVAFLSDRYSGIPFSEATGYQDYMKRKKPDDSEDGEDDIFHRFEKFENYL